MPAVGSQGSGICLCPCDGGRQALRGRGKAEQPRAGLTMCPRAICKLMFQQQKKTKKINTTERCMYSTERNVTTRSCSINPPGMS